jgi:hypothetical protein
MKVEPSPRRMLSATKRALAWLTLICVTMIWLSILAYMERVPSEGTFRGYVAPIVLGSSFLVWLVLLWRSGMKQIRQLKTGSLSDVDKEYRMEIIGDKVSFAAPQKDKCRTFDLSLVSLIRNGHMGCLEVRSKASHDSFYESSFAYPISSFEKKDINNFIGEVRRLIDELSAKRG